MSLLAGEVEIFLGVIVADPSYNFLEGVNVIGIESFLNPFTENPAKYTAEQFMTRIAQEAPAVRQHSHKSGQVSETR